MEMIDKRHWRQRGFTLVELLVVISIISLLSSVVFSSVNSARAKARNARERSDVRQIILALELARSNSPTDQYPLSAASGTNWSCFRATGGTCWRANYNPLPAQAVTDLAPYLAMFPPTAVSAPTTACYANDSYLYISNIVSPGWRPGAYIIWAKETAGAFAPGECVSFDSGGSSDGYAYDCGLRYCYQFIGTN